MQPEPVAWLLLDPIDFLKLLSWVAGWVAGFFAYLQGFLYLLTH